MTRAGPGGLKRQYRVVRTRYGRMLVNPADTVIARALLTHGEYSPGEVDLFRAILSPGSVVVDAGANIGCFTLVFAQCVGPTGTVFAFEPQRLIFQLLCANLALNGVTCVHARQHGLGAERSEMTVPDIDYELPNNFGALPLRTAGRGERVAIETIDALELADCALIKADVQGMERAVLQGAAQTIARCRPILYLENDDCTQSRALLQDISAHLYEAYWHIPWVINPQRAPVSGDETIRRNISANLLCVPEGTRVDARGVRRVTGPDDWWRG